MRRYRKMYANERRIYTLEWWGVIGTLTPLRVLLWWIWEATCLCFLSMAHFHLLRHPLFLLHLLKALLLPDVGALRLVHFEIFNLNHSTTFRLQSQILRK
jgi:hypothetical protein